MTHRLLASALAWWIALSSAAHAQSRDVRPESTPVAPSAPAQGVDPAPPVAPASVERMRHPDGRSGYWLDEDAYTEALGALSLEAGYIERLDLAARRLTLREREASELRAALAATARARDEIRAVLRTAEARRVAAERSRDAWYRAPALWLGVGAFLGASLAVLLAFAIGGST